MNLARALTLGSYGVGSAYDPVVTAWATVAAPPPTVALAVNAFVLGTKADGDWSLYTRFKILCAGSADTDFAKSLVDLVDPTKVGTRQNSMTYTGGQGFTGDGVSSYIDWGEPYNGSVAFARDSHHVGYWANGGATTATRQVGTVTGSNILVTGRGSAGTETHQLCDGTNTTFFTRGTTTTINGHRIATRTAAAATKGYFNGAAGTSSVIASTVEVPTANASLAKSSTIFSAARFALMHWGAAVADAQAARMYSRQLALLTAIGAAT